MERYQEVSRRVREIFLEVTPLVEPVSIDEAFLDIGSRVRQGEDPVRVAAWIRARIREQTGLTASVGLAVNKFLAKLASDLRKPDGLTVVPDDPDCIRAFLAPLPVRCIWGVGPVAEERLVRNRLRTIGDVQVCDTGRLQRLLGSGAAVHIRELACGIDHRPVEIEHEEKSVSHETTFDEDCADTRRVRSVLVHLVERVGRRLRRGDKRGRTAQLKLRFSDFRTITRQQSLGAATNSDRRLLACALELFDAERVHEPVRLVGFGVSGLVDTGDGREARLQPLLFPSESAADPVQEAELDRAVDSLRERYGPAIIRRGLGD
jgi:DNA polymerase-4